ncbi:hypothetical protein [Burkholderia sp. TSV86]|uniref:hypothetical protein n=1 Tax=Burkholderia sp. TSV86 TaxID=1385594 RepID=UPI00075E6568|nr:hypothetical protein [Burkholderia sp. TSV86]
MKPCDVCLPFADERPPSDAPLIAIGKPTKLRPLMSKPLIVGKFRCHTCGAYWMRETDMSEPQRDQWLFLGNATSILEPAARRP